MLSSIIWRGWLHEPHNTCGAPFNAVEGGLPMMPPFSVATVILVCAPLILTIPAASATYHVDPSAEPGGDGSASWPFDRLNYASEAASFGDTILLAAGVYRETLPISVDGHPRKAILLLHDGVTVIGAGRGQTVLEAPPDPVLTFGVTATGVSRSTAVMDLTIAGHCFQGINLRGSSPTLRRLEIANLPTGLSSVACDARDGSYPLCVDCRFAGGHSALFVEFFSGGDFVNCSTGRMPNDGLVLHNADPVFTGCVFESAGRTTIRLSQGSQPVLKDCRIDEGGLWTVRVSLYPPDSIIDLSGNSWFTNDVVDIGASIFDALDDPSVGGTVLFLPILQGVDAAASSWGRVKAMFK
jgi:hypothetical protein